MNGSNINDTLFMLDDIRVGLQSLDDEEENLIILKSHLAKIKKIREDQIRKDELVITLKDRINVLENELTVSNRQSFELQEILSERIMTLENSLKDRNDLEISCYELNERIESFNAQKGLSDADLEFERNKNHDHRLSHAVKDKEILSLKTALQSDQQVIVQMQAYFESLKTELNNKEQVITVHSKKHKDTVALLRNELAISKQTVSDMAGQLVKAEEARLKQDEEAAAARQEIEKLRAEGTARRVELGQWKTMYQELEAVVLAVKTQLSATQEGLGQELTTLREELGASRKDTKDSRVELRSVHHTLASITHDMDIISSFEQQKSAQGGPTMRTTTQRAEILALALSMQRSTASLGLADGDDHTRSSSLAHINRDVQRIMAFMSDLVHRLVAQQEEGAALDQQLHQRTEAVTSVSTLVSRFEEKYSSAKQELSAVDEALKGVVTSLSHCFPSVTRDGGLVTRSNQSFLASKRGSPNKREDTQRRSDMKSESRAALLDQLTQLAESARAVVLETVPSLHSELNALRVRSADDLRATEERHEATLRRLEDANRVEEQRLLGEIQTLRQENEDAVIAVETTTWESQNEVKRMRAQCKARLGEDQLGLAAENSGLHASLRTCNERYQAVTLSLEHVLHHAIPLAERYRTLQAAYRMLYLNWFHRVDQLVEGVQALSDCCGAIDEDSPPHEEHIIHGKVSTTRPSASSRDQRLKHLREKQNSNPGGTPTKDSKTRRQTTRPITLRIVGLLVLAANRFLRYRYSRHAALDDQTNLVAVSTAREAGLSGCAEASFQSHFLVCYPAFDLPALETLLSESSRIVTEQLLQAAAAQRADSGSFSAYGGRSLLDAVKTNPHGRNRGGDLLCARDMERVQVTLVETCNRARHWRDEESKAEAVIDALQSQVADLEESLRSALSTEQDQQKRIDALEKERRFGSLTILRDIHNELKEHEADVKQHNERHSKPVAARPVSAPMTNQRPVAHLSSSDGGRLASSSGSREYQTVSRDHRYSSDDRRDDAEDVSEEEEDEEDRDYSRELREAMGATDDPQRSSGSLHFQSRQVSEAPLQRPRQTSSSSRYSQQSSQSSSGEVYRAVKATRSSRFSNYSEYVAERDGASKQKAGRSHTTLRDDDRFVQCAAQVRDMIHDSSRSLSEAGAADRSFDAMNTTTNTFDSSDLTRTHMDDSGYSSGGSHSRTQTHSRSLPSSTEKDRRAARLAANQSRDDDILEIYSDIGRLTGRLESRLRTSSNASPEQQKQQR